MSLFGAPAARPPSHRIDEVRRPTIGSATNYATRFSLTDEPFDRCFLEGLPAGTPDRLGALYSFRSAATESGAGELRTGLPVAAMGAVQPGIRATLVDYFRNRARTR